MEPLQNPFYAGLPYDDINDEHALATRSDHVPWAADEPYASRADDQTFSFMKDRWVEIRRAEFACFGQIEDAGPGRSDDARYVFSHTDRRPANRRRNGAGMDVSPAINGCLGFADLDGEDDQSTGVSSAAKACRGPWKAWSPVPEADQVEGTLRRARIRELGVEQPDLIRLHLSLSDLNWL